MSSSSSLSRSSPVLQPIPPPDAEARRRLSVFITVITRICWCVAVAFFLMTRSMNREWSNSCHRVFAGPCQMLLMVALCFSSALSSFVAAQCLRLLLLDPVVEKKMLVIRVRLGVGLCLVSSWSGVFAVMMWVQMLLANTIDCKNTTLYHFSVAASFVTNLGVLGFYLLLGSYVRSG